MAKVFFPKDFILVDSNSSNHPQHTQYKVSLGIEEWDDKYVDVIKIQMQYDGKVAGRRSPSYPIDSDDYIRVHEAVLEIKKRNNII